MAIEIKSIFLSCLPEVAKLPCMHKSLPYVKDWHTLCKVSDSSMFEVSDSMFDITSHHSPSDYSILPL